MAEARATRMALVVKSDTFEDFLLALSFAGIGADSEMNVSLFFTNRAARRLHIDGFADLAQAAPDDAVGARIHRPRRAAWLHRPRAPCCGR